MTQFMKPIPAAMEDEPEPVHVSSDEEWPHRPRSGLKDMEFAGELHGDENNNEQAVYDDGMRPEYQGMTDEQIGRLKVDNALYSNDNAPKKVFNLVDAGNNGLLKWPSQDSPSLSVWLV
jgi:hypothetical protein